MMSQESASFRSTPQTLERSTCRVEKSRPPPALPTQATRDVGGLEEEMEIDLLFLPCSTPVEGETRAKGAYLIALLDRLQTLAVKHTLSLLLARHDATGANRAKRGGRPQRGTTAAAHSNHQSCRRVIRHFADHHLFMKKKLVPATATLHHHDSYSSCSGWHAELGRGTGSGDVIHPPGPAPGRLVTPVRDGIVHHGAVVPDQ